MEQNEFFFFFFESHDLLVIGREQLEPNSRNSVWSTTVFITMNVYSISDDKIRFKNNNTIMLI